MRRAGLDDLDDVCLYSSGSSLPEEVITALDFESENLTDLNELCRAVQLLSAEDLEKLGAVVSFARPERAGEITNLAKALELFDFVPRVRTPEEYGKYMILESGRFEYDEDLAGYIDFAKYGADRMDHEQGRFVDRGYAAYRGTMGLDELMTDEPNLLSMGGIKME